jgi:four helix bundle protein
MVNYRTLEFWRRSRVLAVRIHRLVQRLPRAEQVRRGDQLVRAADSIRNNIVEGAPAETKREFARYLQYAIRSANEVQSELEGLNDIDLLPPADHDLLGEPEQIAAMMAAYRNKMLKSDEDKKEARR